MHPSFGSMILTSQDISDGGLFLLTQGRAMPPVGSMVEVQSLVFGEAAPVLQAKIVRQTDDGIGLMFQNT